MVLAAAGTLLLAASPMAQPRASAQRGTAKWTAPRTPWGDPDLQGIYTNKDENNTPFERPPELAGKRIADFGEKEMAELRKERQLAAARQASSIGGTAENDTGAGPPHWYEHFDAENAQPWLVIDPEDGRVPPLTAAARERAAARQAARRGRGPADSYTDRSIYDRCISRGVPDSIRPIIYGASYDITQSPGYVVIRYEMVHEARVIPLDGRRKLSPAIRQYMGDSRGWWEGDTLVVETNNLRGAEDGPYDGWLDVNGSPYSQQAKFTERFRRPSYGQLQIDTTVDDPKAYTKPWTVRVDQRILPDEEMIEFICNENQQFRKRIKID
jgi:hypothetical protein